MEDSLLQLSMEEELRHKIKVLVVSAQGIMGVKPQQAVNTKAYESLAVMCDVTIQPRMSQS